jgi:hypothetical protein
VQESLHQANADVDIVGLLSGDGMTCRFEYQGLAEVVEASKLLNPHFREGFVVCDHRFNRLKVRPAAAFSSLPSPSSPR